MRYLYWGFTGARFGRSAKVREGDESREPGNWTVPGLAHRIWMRPGEDAAEQPKPDSEAEPVRDSSLEQTIARLTAERDSARSERELEADYREALLRDVEMLRSQLDEAQRRIMEFERGRAFAPLGEAADKTDRERALEQELLEARRRLSETVQPVDTAPARSLPAAPGGDEMMDIFLQFVGTQERRPDVET